MKFLRCVLCAGALLWAGLAIVSPAHAANELGTGICETSVTTGTGTLSLQGAYTSGGVTYLSFASQIASGNSVPYTITASDGKFEHGTTVFTDAGTDTLTRNSLWSSDGSGVELTLPAGTHIVCLQIGEASHGDGDRGDIVVTDGFQAWAVDANSVALTTDTTGNYAAGDGEAGAALTGDSATAFFSAGTLELARGGTGSSLADPGGNRIMAWDDTANAVEFQDAGTGLTAGVTTLDCDTASTGAVGCAALATTTEVLTGTETGKAVTPDALAALWEKGSNVASAGTVSLGEGWVFHITGTTTITDIDFATAKDGRQAVLIFDGALTLTYNATTLDIPGGASITTAAGDVAFITQDSSDNIKVTGYVRDATTPPSGVNTGDQVAGAGLTGTATLAVGAGTAITVNADDVAVTANGIGPTQVDESATFGTWTNIGTITTADINGGTLDGAVIGGASAAAITGTTITATTGLRADANDGADIGAAATAFSDLYLAEGGTITWDNTDCILTQTGDVLATTGCAFSIASVATITLGTDTAGNYVDNVTGGLGITVTHTPAEGSEPDVVFAPTELSSVTWGAGAFTTMTYDAGATDPVITFGSGTILMEGVTSFRQADAANLGGNITLREDPSTGSDSLGFLAPASVTTSQTCTLENDASFIPDACVGDGTDAGGSGVSSTGTPVDNQVAVWTNSTTIEGDTAFTFDTASDALSIGTSGVFTAGTIELGHATANTLSASGGVLSVEGVPITPGTDVIGKQSFYLPIGSCWPGVTAAANFASWDSGSSDIAAFTADFDQGATEERIECEFTLPKQADESVGFSFKYHMLGTVGSNGFVFEALCVGLTHDAVFNGTTLAGSVTSAVTQTAASDYIVSTESSATTCNSTIGEGDLIHVRFSRDTSNGSDTNTGDARVFGFTIYWTNNAGTDD